ncbi:uncharacterized protein A1O9_03637 [Exophiala aquamarina CBS 119918]|uniref:Uncharacterized protein n=1 Tax=Exophiala aquamarina CBS 119918 TaxID=1182545 RepID=A0A072PFD5_9EURO|nr:uncharacterized protein A1O9_03637 [Exophiala aquamarina CBS 119918]KEF58794.1 hypothetical protein A1O9_03637 [Exophiala aquamarina CBS 119918]
MKAISSLLIIQLLWRAASADRTDVYCIDGIRTSLAGIVFDGTIPGDYWTNICTNNLSVTSMWAAANVYCSDHEITAGEEMLGGYCKEYGLVTLIPYNDILPTLTKKFINSLPIVEFEDTDSPVIWNSSILMSAQLFTASKRTVVRWHTAHRERHKLIMPQSAFAMSYILDSRYG